VSDISGNQTVLLKLLILSFGMVILGSHRHHMLFNVKVDVRVSIAFTDENLYFDLYYQQSMSLFSLFPLLFSLFPLLEMT
jgi:hypothetical protein